MPEILSAYGDRLIIATVVVSVALILFAFGYRFVKSRTGPAPFIRGGKNRNPRLQVLDAAAVDNQRRLVLIRRDNVEHLIMIGGTTDIVIESGIAASAAGREMVQPALAARSVQPEPPSAPAFDLEHRPQPAIETRPLPAQRVAAAAPAEPRFEPAGEAAFTPEPAKPSRPAPTPTKPIPVPPVNLAAEAPAPTARIEPPAQSMPQQSMPEVRAEPLRPIAALAAANAAANTQNSNAAALLDSARDRVFQPAPEPRVVAAPVASPMPASLQHAAENPRQFGNDFERILEEEMANNLAAREASSPAGQQNRQIPPRDPSTPKVTGTTPEPTLQNEVARIFGEMSVTRDK